MNEIPQVSARVVGIVAMEQLDNCDIHGIIVVTSRSWNMSVGDGIADCENHRQTSKCKHRQPHCLAFIESPPGMRQYQHRPCCRKAKAANA